MADAVAGLPDSMQTVGAEGTLVGTVDRQDLVIPVYDDERLLMTVDQRLQFNWWLLRCRFPDDCFHSAPIATRDPVISDSV